ncbi:hypothetical protein [Occallatibacter savannae]|uniref:hypothetical protein n=1 Tax=Occallatibacter savannae TaxID=1002691 RepID=UPI000D69F5C6|nr:hypothetical protein [Occallatibacter savannae]
MLMCSFSSTGQLLVFSAPILFWLFLFGLVIGIFMAVKLYRYWKIISDLRSQNDAIESERRHLEVLTRSLLASKAVLEASNQDLRAENDRLEHRMAEFTELQREKDHLEEQIVELTSTGPRLHGVWNNSQTFWQIGRKDTKRIMRIGGRISLASSNTDEVLHVLAGYIEGQRMDLIETISIRPDVIEDEQVVLCISPPIEADERCSFTASIVLEDHQNRLHTLPKHSFRPTQQAPPWLSKDLATLNFEDVVDHSPPPNIGSLTGIISIAMRFLSGSRGIPIASAVSPNAKQRRCSLNDDYILIQISANLPNQRRHPRFIILISVNAHSLTLTRLLLVVNQLQRICSAGSVPEYGFGVHCRSIRLSPSARKPT